MASQQPRPAWFRLSALANRPVTPAPAPAPAPPPVAQPAPAPAPAPIRPLAPIPTVMRPTIPIGMPTAPTQTQEPAPPPAPAVASPPLIDAPPTPPKSPTVAPAPIAALSGPTAAPSRSPVATPPPYSASPRSPIATAAQVTPVPSSPVEPPATAAPPRSPPAQIAAPPKSPVTSPPPQPSPKKVPASGLPSQTPPPPPSTTAPQPSPVLTKPLTTSTYLSVSSSFTPASPKTKSKSKSPSTSVQTSPVPRLGASAVALNGTSNLKATTPVSSPKIIKPLEATPEQSPRIKPLSNPPSPFTLPPVQKTEDEIELKIPAEVEQKTVLVQETIEKPMKMANAYNNGIDSNRRRDPTIKDKGTNKKNFDSEEFGMSVITLAGENKGAIMELSPSQKKIYSTRNPQSSQKTKNISCGSNFDQSSSGSGEEGKSNRKDKTKTNKAMALQSQPIAVFLNSNVQGVNNSILYNCNYRHNDPGVHLSLAKKVNGSRPKDHHG